ELLQREHHLDRIEHGYDPRQPSRGQAAREPDELVARDPDIDELSRELFVRKRHGLCRDVQVESVARDEPVERVEVLLAFSIEGDDAAVLERELGLRVVRPVHGNEPELREGLDQHFAAELAPFPRDKALRPVLVHPPANRASRMPPWPRARTEPPGARRILLPAARPTP